MIKSGGENVASVKIEETLLAHPAVLAAAVVGLPHPQWGEAVSAFIKLLDEMPMTATGKLRKVELRQQFSEHFAQG
jgi:long-chain acyl-CoA synthetase